MPNSFDPWFTFQKSYVASRKKLVYENSVQLIGKLVKALKGQINLPDESEEC